MFVCKACGKELSKKDALLTLDKECYCSNTHTCNDEHINSIKNVLIRKSGVELYEPDDIELIIFSKLDLPEDFKEKIMKVIKKPQSIRIHDIKMARFLVEYIETYQLGSLSEAVRECVEFAMYNGVMGNKPIPEIESETKPEPTPDPVGIKLDLREKETVPADEDDMTF